MLTNMILGGKKRGSKESDLPALCTSRRKEIEEYQKKKGGKGEREITLEPQKNRTFCDQTAKVSGKKKEKSSAASPRSGTQKRGGKSARRYR